MTYIVEYINKTTGDLYQGYYTEAELAKFEEANSGYEIWTINGERA